VGGFLPNVAVTLLASLVVLAVFLAFVAMADGGDLRAVVRSAAPGGRPPWAHRVREGSAPPANPHGPP